MNIGSLVLTNGTATLTLSKRTKVMNILKKQLKRFIIAGCCATSVDAIVYYTLLNIISHSPSKALSFLAGACTAYLVNKNYTFSQYFKSYSEMIRFSSLYFITFIINVACNKLALVLSSDAVTLSFIVATAITMCCNFLGQKLFVFKPLKVK